jgi:hypothetical protein
MPYKFTFDLSKIPRFVFTEIAKTSYQRGMHKQVGETAKEMIRKFKIQEATGLDLCDAITLLQDLIETQTVNLIERERFIKTKKRALFLPHCSRKYMDGRCKASFNANIPSYVCAHCSQDCLVENASTLALEKGYDVYILPGGSCIPKILKTNRYDGVVGVACGGESKVGGEVLKTMNVVGQNIPLIKNGCTNTAFNIETLNSVL